MGRKGTSIIERPYQGDSSGQTSPNVPAALLFAIERGWRKSITYSVLNYKHNKCKKAKLDSSLTLLQLVLVCVCEMNGMFSWNWWNCPGMKPERAMLNLDLWSCTGLPFTLQVQPGPLRSPCSSEDPQSLTLRVNIFDSILLCTFIGKKTKRMISQCLRKPNYQFWSVGQHLCCPVTLWWQSGFGWLLCGLWTWK